MDNRTVTESTPNGGAVQLSLESNELAFGEFVEAIEAGEAVDDDIIVVLPLNDFIRNTMTKQEALNYLDAKGR